MKIPLFDPKRHFEADKKEYLKAVNKVLSSGRLVLGPQTKKFEQEFADFCGTKYAAMVNSGTSALLASLLAFKIGKGDEVITVPNSFAATVQAIIFSGAKPVFVDIDPETCNINPQKITSAVSKKTKAIIPVHLYGHPAEMDKINKIAQKYKLTVIEDAAQAHGAKYKKKLTGNLGHAGCFSFFVNKNLPSFGTAGMVTTNNKKIADRVKILRDNGMVEKGKHTVSLNFMPEEIQAAFLRIKLRKINKWNLKRRAIAKLYDKSFKNLLLKLPSEKNNCYHVYHHYVIRTRMRDQLQNFLTKKGIQCRAYYPIPIHLQPGFEFLNYQKGSFPITEKFSKEILSLSIFPQITKAEVNFIRQNVKIFFEQ